MPITIHCNACGSQDVYRDAFASWNTETQQWELVAVYDAATCEACEDDTTLIERAVECSHSMVLLSPGDCI